MGSEFGRYFDSNYEAPEDGDFGRSPPRGGAGGRDARGSRDGRDRDDYRSSDPYRDRRRSPGQPRHSTYRNSPHRRRQYSRHADRRRDRERRRSRSPTNIDRYAPSDRVSRDDYYGSRNRDDRDGHRERRRSSPQPSSIDRYVPGMPDPTPPQLLVNPLQDPMKLEFQVGFTWFAEWWRSEQRIKEEKERQKTGRAPRVRGERETKEDREAERPKIQAAYDAYKEKLQKTQAQMFVRAHKEHDWFKEKYSPEARNAFRAKLAGYRQELFNLWQSDLENGTFDEFTLEGLYKSDAVANGTAAEREEGETTGANEVLGVGDLVPSKGGELRDPMAALPTLLVKTIAPTVSRDKMMEFAKEHLNGGDDSDVEGGFKWLSLSDPNPLKRCHRMGWIILNPETSEPAEEMIEEPADRDEGEDGEEGEAIVTERSPPKTTTEKGLERINGKTIEDPDRGNFTLHCGVHRPPEAPRKKALWDLFSAPERISRDLDLATRLVRKLDNELGEEYFGVAMIEKRVQDLADRGLLAPPEKPPVMNDYNMDVEDGEEEEGALPDEDDEMDDEDSLIMKKKLDLLVEYLRRVYNFCFFCVFESDSVHELQRKCPGGHLRRPRSSLTTAAKEVARASAEGQPFPLSTYGNKNESAIAEDGEMAIDPESPSDERKASTGLVGGVKMSGKTVNQLQRAYKWVKTFEEKILQIVEPENADIQKLGGVELSKGLEDDLQKFVKQEDTNKFRCKVPTQPASSTTAAPALDQPITTLTTANAPELGCTKLFKGLDFWRKHVEKRHPEFYQKLIAEIELVNRYVLDPAHIAPSRSDANSNGHFPTGGNAPTGTPRGFQLPSHMPMGFPMMAGQGMPMMPPGMMPGWNAAMSGMPGLAGVGPVRNHGRNNFNGRMQGPYTRNDGRGNRLSRGPSIPGIPGLPAGGFGGVPAFGAIGGVTGLMGADGSIGPSEAVAGRSLKSYEDLDAAGDGGKGGGAVELDY